MKHCEFMLILRGKLQSLYSIDPQPQQWISKTCTLIKQRVRVVGLHQ
ncbi:hypothetical protein MtrunA17_Chr3g0132231 [Medicago truncatula]|uniref:Uncharacterized protein n=1 Tax=Medicago truncatula TaxID=3880 RepID=A0A396IWQ2_MEDTR|nr:hypothetical protein MtrunA17_Chr3g0132231 [Medicago truncatula]